MKLHEKLKAQATEFAKANGLSPDAVPSLTQALLMGAAVAMEHFTPTPEIEEVKAPKRELAMCNDSDL